MSSDIDLADRLGRLDAVIARLESLAGPAMPSPLAATDANGFPGPVAPDELIESAWGNAVVGAYPSLDIVATNGGNILGEQIVGTFNVPNVPVARRYVCLWYWQLSGHSQNGTMNLRSKWPGGTLQSLSGDLVYAANWPTMGTWVFEMDVAAGAGGFALSLFCSLTGPSANSNHAGVLHAIGLARHA